MTADLSVVAEAPPEQLHFISWTHDEDGTIVAAFECKGDRAARCHRYTDCRCEVIETCPHPRVPHAVCWAEGWFSEVPAVDLGVFPDGNVAVRSGPIDVWADVQDGLRWEYSRNRQPSLLEALEEVRDQRDAAYEQLAAAGIPLEDVTP